MSHALEEPGPDSTGEEDTGYGDQSLTPGTNSSEAEDTGERPDGQDDGPA